MVGLLQISIKIPQTYFRAFLLSACILCLAATQAQVSNYVFSENSGTYTAGAPAGSSTPAAAFPASWDDETTVYNFPFNFYYNGTTYTTAGSIGISANGWIAFSTGAISLTGTGAGGSFVSKLNPTGLYLSGTGNNNGVAGFNADLQEQTFSAITATAVSGSNILTGVSSFVNIETGTRLSGTGISNGTVVTAFDAGSGTITLSSNATVSGTPSIVPSSSIYAFTRGTAPNREMVVQWTQVKRYNASNAEQISFQIILKEAAAVAGNQSVEIVFGNVNTLVGSTLSVQCGLRGNNAADFNARTTNSNWSASTAATVNTQVLDFSSVIQPVNGETYSWLPCSSAPGSVGAISGAPSVCAGSTNAYNVTAVGNANFYAWTYSGTGASFSATTTTASNSITFSSGASNGTLTVYAVNACGNGPVSTVAITVNPLPTATISYPSSQYCTNTGGSITVTVSGTSGGTFSSTPAGLQLNPTTGAITPSGSTPGNYIVTYSFNNGTCFNTSTTPMKISATMSGTYTIGSGGDFATLTAAAAAYNNNCQTGAIVFSLISASYTTGETFPVVFNKNSSASAVNTLTIKPAAGVTATIYGVLNNDALIKIYGDYISIDGSNNGSNSRNLTIWNEGSVKPRVLLFGSNSTNATTNNTLKNCLIRNGTTDAGAIVVSDAGTIANPGYFSNISITNNQIINSFYGIYCNAVVTGTNGSGLLIQQNDMSASGATAIQFTGIFIQGVNGVTIKNNLLSNFKGNDDASDNGIWINTGVKNAVISYNTISNLNYTNGNGHGPRGIFISSGVTNANILIANNMIANLSGDGFNYNDATLGLNNPTGILLSSSTAQSDIRIYNNSIYLGGVSGFTNTLNKANALSACVRMRTDSYIDLRNNILVNNLGLAAATGLGSTLVMATSSVTQFTNLNFNNYSMGATGSGWKTIAMIAGTPYNSLAAWRTASGQDASSLNVVPVFVSGSDLHLDNASNAALFQKGSYFTEAPDDIDGFTRHPVTAAMGCDEFVPLNTAHWIGKTSTDWTVATNWEDNKTPSGTISVTIAGGYNNLPVINGTQAVNGLNLLSPGTPPVLTLAAGSTLQINGAMTKTGAAYIVASDATIECNGSAAQTIPATFFQNNLVKNLVVGNSSAGGLTLAGTLEITRSLNFGSSGLTLNTGDFLVLRSTAAETAWVGDLTGKTINGQATVERYIPTGINHNKSWQFLAVPLNATQTIQQAWQEGNAPMANGTPGYGTIITGNVSGATALGFDIGTSAASGPGMKTFNALTNSWVGVASTNATNISNAKGYMILVRGDRSVTTASAPATPTVLRAKGNLYTATVGQLPPSTTVAANSFASIGNPYASAIDFLNINKLAPAFIDHTFYVWDPLLAGTSGLGGYQTISSTNGYKPLPGGTSNYPGDSVITTIQSGQAFLVHATGPGSGGTISFNESSKKSGSRMVHRSGGADLSGIRMSLYTKVAGEDRLTDACAIRLNESFNNGYDYEDALKWMNATENIALSQSGQLLTVEARKPFQANDTVWISLKNLKKQIYRIILQPESLTIPAMQAFVLDRYLQTETPVSTTSSLTVEFMVTDDAGSAQENRFLITFKPTVVLPVSWLQVKAARKANQQVDINWSVAQEQSVATYRIFRSTDGSRFQPIGAVPASANSAAVKAYRYVDADQSGRAFFYRIQSVDLDGKTSFSEVVSVDGKSVVPGFRLIQQPAQNPMLQIEAMYQPAGKIAIELFQMNGQKLASYQQSLQGQIQEIIYVNLPASLPAGKYLLRITNAQQQVQTLELLQP
jgi:hypothetical protein